MGLHPEKNDQAIADHVGVCNKTVNNAKKQLCNLQSSTQPTTKTGKDGKEYPTEYKPRTEQEPQPKEEPTPTKDQDKDLP